MLAVEAGVDVELPSTVVYGKPLLEAMAEGRVDEALVDRIVGRILRQKFELGLFDRPYVDLPTAPQLAELGEDETRVARELARRSLVLARERRDPPAAGGSRAGRRHRADRRQRARAAGRLAHLLHIETLLEMRQQGNAFGFPLTDEVVPVDELAGRRTMLDALVARFPRPTVSHARGTGIRGGTDADLAEAVALARSCAVAIVVLGERSGLTDNATTGEFRDRLDLGFMGRQQELLEAVVATGTPVVLVVVSGRPLAIEWAADPLCRGAPGVGAG